ncbi:MAG: ABC transporter permease subunit [Firmicutes bacterium]|nr:ABC transporter permease subunit [Bacillota bacterium]
MTKIKNKILGYANNPIVKREIKQTFRKAKIFWILAVYLFALSGISFMVLSSISSAYGGYNPMLPSAMYFVILGMQMLLLTLITPISTSTAISGEKERQTFDLLIITKTSMYDIIMGKLLSSLMITVIMIVLSMPVYAVVFYYGGVSVIQFLLNQLYLLCYASMVGSLGIVFSTTMKKSTAATVATIALIFAMTIGVWMAVGMLGVMTMAFTRSEVPLKVVCTLFMFNPIVSFVSMVDSQMGTTASWDLMDEIGYTFENNIIYFWHINMLLYCVITHFLVKFAAKRIAPMRRK